jgi:hypothetical protein
MRQIMSHLKLACDPMSSLNLPRGQRAINFFPRFGVPRFAHRLPSVPQRPAITIDGLVETPFQLELNTLVLPQARPQAAARYLRFVSLDGYDTCIDRRDIDRETLLADQLDGEPLPLEHGAPLRLVAPALYGYKNPKHLNRIEFLSDYHRGRAERQTLAHPRGRVAFEERGRFLPGWIYRYVYRAFVPSTLAWYARAARRGAP